MTAYTANKEYPIQPVGSNVGKWGAVLNTELIQVLDGNLGGTYTPDVSGSANFEVSDTNAQNLNHVLSGVLTGSIEYVLPARGSFYILTNSTSGAFSVTAIPLAGTGVVIPQTGSPVLVFTDGVTLDIVGGSGGSASGQQVTITASDSPYTVPDAISQVYCDCTAGSISINAPSGLANKFRQVTYTKIGSSGNTVTLTPTSGQIAGAASAVLYSPAEAFPTTCDGTNLWIF